MTQTTLYWQCVTICAHIKSNIDKKVPIIRMDKFAIHVFIYDASP